MRIEAPNTLLQALLASPLGVRRGGAVVAFDLGAVAGPPTTAAPLAANPPGSVAMLVALAAAERPPEHKAEVVRAAQLGVGGLAELHRDMISGVASPQRLRGLRDWARRRPRSEDPQLEAVLDEVELRIMVELAKRGLD